MTKYCEGVMDILIYSYTTICILFYQCRYGLQKYVYIIVYTRINYCFVYSGVALWITRRQLSRIFFISVLQRHLINNDTSMAAHYMFKGHRIVLVKNSRFWKSEVRLVLGQYWKLAYSLLYICKETYIYILSMERI